MGSLYIGGAQCVFAKFLTTSDARVFDAQVEHLRALAEKFDVHVDRKKMKDQGDYYFVLMNEEINTVCFYEGAAFEVDMGVNTSNTFHTRASAYVKALNATRALANFHNLQWGSPKVLYFVSS